jgi:hypothetical protein
MSLIEQRESIAAYTIDEFCHAHRIGRATLYELWKRGVGPRFSARRRALMPLRRRVARP